jgi:hypothetical protein
MKNIFKLSVISVILVTLFSLMVYVTAQQMLRQGVNSTPAALTADVIYKLESGVSPKSVMLPPTAEISKSISPFVIILDQNKNVLVSSATLDGSVPVIPQGTFDWVEKSGQDRVTWQPQPGVREALVIDKYSASTTSGYVVAGASLKESESTIDKLGRNILVGWFVINAFAFASIVFLSTEKLWKKK